MSEYPRIGGVHDVMNDAFHGTYDRDREEAAHAPVFVVTSNDMFVCRGGAQSRFPVSTPEYHRVKSIAHAPVAVRAMLEKPLDREALARLRVALVDETAHDELREILDLCIAEIEHAMAGSGGLRAAQEQHAFSRRCGPLLLRAFERATKLQLDSLHAQTESAVSGLTPEERHAFLVVVTGDHQARRRSLAMQYFRKRLREREGIEDRVFYGEGICSVDDALAFVRKNRLDRSIAHAFFDDEHRLQRDLLGDSAAKLLAEVELTPLT